MTGTIADRETLPLSGVKVLDFGQYIAGPAVAMILGDLGATVVRVDPPWGPRWNSPANATLNRNKAIVALDLKTASAETWLSRLVAADVGAVCDDVETIRTASTRVADGTAGTERGSCSFSSSPDHPSGHAVTQLDPYAIRPTHGTVYAMAPAEKYGASTRSVLRAIGYGDAEIDARVAAGAVSESWSREYLPS